MIWLTACTTAVDPRSVHPPDGMTVSPVVDLLRVKTSRDKVRAVTDRQGVVHVIIASSTLRQVVEVLVARQGVLRQRVIRSGVVPWNVDAAFDRRGRLHVLLDKEHLVFDGGAWKTGATPPWQAAGLKAYTARFVPGAPMLIWTFAVDGSDVGSPRRLDIYGFGGYGGALVWPWITGGTHTVLVAEAGSGYGPWLVVEPNNRLDSRVVDAAADPAGNVFLTYSLARGGMAASSTRRFVWIKAGSLQAVGSDSNKNSVNAAVKLRSIEGGMIGDQAVVRALASGAPVAITKPKSFYLDTSFLSADTGRVLHSMSLGQAHDAWLGNFYPVLYQRHSGHGWSTPFELGHADSASFSGALDIAGSGPSRAFVVWPTDDAIVGRWVDSR